MPPADSDPGSVPGDNDAFRALRVYVDAQSRLAGADAKLARAQAETSAREVAALRHQLADLSAENARLRGEVAASQNIQDIQRRQLETERTAFEGRAQALQEAEERLRRDRRAMAEELERAAKAMKKIAERQACVGAGPSSVPDTRKVVDSDTESSEESMKVAGMGASSVVPATRKRKVVVASDNSDDELPKGSGIERGSYLDVDTVIRSMKFKKSRPTVSGTKAAEAAHPLSTSDICTRGYYSLFAYDVPLNFNYLDLDDLAAPELPLLSSHTQSAPRKARVKIHCSSTSDWWTSVELRFAVALPVRRPILLSRDDDLEILIIHATDPWKPGSRLHAHSPAHDGFDPQCSPWALRLRSPFPTHNLAPPTPTHHRTLAAELFAHSAPLLRDAPAPAVPLRALLPSYTAVDVLRVTAGCTLLVYATVQGHAALFRAWRQRAAPSSPSGSSIPCTMRISTRIPRTIPSSGALCEGGTEPDAIRDGAAEPTQGFSLVVQQIASTHQAPSFRILLPIFPELSQFCAVGCVNSARVLVVLSASYHPDVFVSLSDPSVHDGVAFLAVLCTAALAFSHPEISMNGVTGPMGSRSVVALTSKFPRDELSMGRQGGGIRAQRDAEWMGASRTIMSYIFAGRHHRGAASWAEASCAGAYAGVSVRGAPGKPAVDLVNNGSRLDEKYSRLGEISVKSPKLQRPYVLSTKRGSGVVDGRPRVSERADRERGRNEAREAGRTHKRRNWNHPACARIASGSFNFMSQGNSDHKVLVTHHLSLPNCCKEGLRRSQIIDSQVITVKSRGTSKRSMAGGDEEAGGMDALYPTWDARQRAMGQSVEVRLHNQALTAKDSQDVKSGCAVPAASCMTRNISQWKRYLRSEVDTRLASEPLCEYRFLFLLPNDMR
ncbi:hypothetical protein FB451DRAFT_1189935 [Mycena latifolia]|nr:hypothetical protein FB451DRAFT_1189935 [Mycena latifolia]